jgi:hypothetical protein
MWAWREAKAAGKGSGLAAVKHGRSGSFHALFARGVGANLSTPYHMHAATFCHSGESLREQHAATPLAH